MIFFVAWTREFHKLNLNEIEWEILISAKLYNLLNELKKNVQEVCPQSDFEMTQKLKLKH